MLSLSALGMAALGTTLRAQQSDEPAPAQAPAAAALSKDEGSLGPAELSKAAASAGTLPSLPATNPLGTQPAQLGDTRASSPGNRSNGGGRSVGGPARQARPDLGGVLPSAGPTTYAPAIPNGYSTPVSGPYGYNNHSYDPPRYLNSGPNAYPAVENQVVSVGPDGRPYVRAMSAEEIQSAQEFRQTVESLRKAKTDEEKTDIRAKLNDLVSKQIDQDLAEREKRLTELEAKAKQLRDQLQQRKQSKADIQKMLVMLIENPQGGLGLPPAWMDAINPSGYQTQNYLTPTIAPSSQLYNPQTSPAYPGNATYDAR